MSQSKLQRNLLELLSVVSKLFREQQDNRKRGTTNRSGGPHLKRNSVSIGIVSSAFVVLVTGSNLQKAGAIFPKDGTVGRQSNGSVLLTTDQFITPAGKQIEFNGRPVAVTLSPDGQTAAFLNNVGSSQGKFIVLIDLATGQLKQEFSPTNGGASFDGIAYSKDGSKLFASDASGKLVIATVAADGTLSLDASVSLPDSKSYPGGIAVSKDGQTLYIALSGKNSLGVFDLASRQLVNQIPVGNAPHAIVIADNNSRFAHF